MVRGQAPLALRGLTPFREDQTAIANLRRRIHAANQLPTMYRIKHIVDGSGTVEIFQPISLKTPTSHRRLSVCAKPMQSSHVFEVAFRIWSGPKFRTSVLQPRIGRTHYCKRLPMLTSCWLWVATTAPTVVGSARLPSLSAHLPTWSMMRAQLNVTGSKVMRECWSRRVQVRRRKPCQALKVFS